MKLYELEPNTAVVEHPQDPDVKVELIQPTLRDIIVFREKADAFKTAEERFDGYCRFLGEHVHRISGLVDRAGKAVVLTPPLGAKEIERISAPTFDVEVERDVEVLDAEGKPTGQTERKTMREWFPTYLVSRLMSEETFTAPLAPGRTPWTASTTSD